MAALALISKVSKDPSNAMESIEFNHPTSLSHEHPEVPSGIEAKTSSMIRLKVEHEGDIRVTFKKNVQGSTWSCKLSSTSNWEFNMGGEVSGGSPELSISATDGPSAKAAICAKLTTGYGMSWSEAEECVVSIVSKVNDSNEYSELYGHLDGSVPKATKVGLGVSTFYGGPIGPIGFTLASRKLKTWKTFKFEPRWTKNDLDLIFEERMVGPTKVIDVNFRNQEPEGTIHGLQNVDIKRR